jgi:hypothetical protein
MRSFPRLLLRRGRDHTIPSAPDGQISLRDKNLSTPFAKNISLSPSGKSVLPARPVLSRQEGRIAIVTNAGWDAVDAAALARRFVRRAVSVSECRRAGRTALLRTAKPCGPGTRCWCQVREGEAARPGRPFAVNLRTTVTRRTRRRGERGISRQPIAQGMPECLPLNLYARVHFFFAHPAHETAGAARTRHSLLPLLWGEGLRKPRAITPRERERLSAIESQVAATHSVSSRRRPGPITGRRRGGSALKDEPESLRPRVC